jgi:pantoate--beta-alanine ligase
MQACAKRIAAGEDFDAALNEGRSAIANAGFALDYLELRDADNLGAPAGAQKLRLLLAARIGATRLIDNIDVPLPRRA